VEPGHREHELDLWLIHCFRHCFTMPMDPSACALSFLPPLLSSLWPRSKPLSCCSDISTLLAVGAASCSAISCSETGVKRQTENSMGAWGVNYSPTYQIISS
jgi:hypothetical protein